MVKAMEEKQGGHLGGVSVDYTDDIERTTTTKMKKTRKKRNV
jgi:hypothetical protein